MYVYIFDSFLQDRKYAHELSQVENRLAALGIQGRYEKMTILKNMSEAVRQAIKRGATTIVLVGNDETFTKVLPQLVDHDVTIGFIPLGPHQTIPRALGVPEGLAACDAISRRIVQRIDLGKANNAYFLLNLTAPPTVAITCDGQYSVTSSDPSGLLAITNFAIEDGGGRPDDGRLELVISPDRKRRGWSWGRQSAGSVFPITKAKISAAEGSTNLLLDGRVTIKTPVTVEAAPAKLEVIVGKDRSF